MKKSILLKSLLIATCLPFLTGCVIREEQPNIAAAPPPLAEVQPDAPGPLAVWCWDPGEWVWRGQWVWIGGRWAARPYAGAVWVHGHWGRRGHHRVWVEARWR